MIIQRVEAERLHRYRVLRLADLPEQGIIALSGDNESGKSAIGEIICFALFGRTYALDRDRIGKLVHWGAGQGAVSLRFLAQGKRYQVSRHLVRNGEQSARLTLADTPEEPLARGVEAVDQEIRSLLGYGFEAYIETLYLAQREITMPHPKNPAVRAMVGVAPLERCAEELAREAEDKREEIVRTEGRIAELEQELETLSPELSRVAEIEDQLASFEGRERAIVERIVALESAGDRYCERYRSRGAQGLRRALASFLASITLIAWLGLLVLWGMLHVQPNRWSMPEIRSWLSTLTPEGQSPETFLLYLLTILGGLLLLWWIWLGILAFQNRRRRLAARRLSQELDRLEALEASLPPLGKPKLEIPEEPLISAAPQVERPDAERRSRLQQRILSLEATAPEVRAAIAHEIAWLRYCAARIRGERAHQTAALERIHTDQIRHRELNRRRGKLQSKLQALREEVAVRQLAQELLAGAAQAMSQRFREHLRGMVSQALPQFTEGRYDHLDVDEHFQIRVYSRDKRNLLDLDEISSGTQRQIMLALRLGLAQELVSRLVGEAQFVFLDEPFAFFDSRRMRGALKTLSELGGEVVQHWVVAQRFPQDAPMALEIPCGGHPDSLEIGYPEMH